MLRLLSVLLFCLGLLCLGLLCLGQTRAQIPLTGAGLGAPGGVTYQGPIDAAGLGSAFGAYSVARAMLASYAGSALATVADVSTGLTTCVLSSKANGFADLTTSSCAAGTLTVPAFCTAHTSCVITQVNDQSGNARHVVQATLANMPAIVFNSINGLPAINCATGTSTFLSTSGTFTQAQPFTMSAVYQRTANFTTLSPAMGAAASTVMIGATSSANAAGIDAGTIFGATANDSAWHGIQGLFSGNSSNINIDGVEPSTAAAGGGTLSSEALHLCRAFATQAKGLLPEAIMWAVTSNSTARGNIYTNEHGVNGYNGAF
jgi:hypothetical protein